MRAQPLLSATQCSSPALNSRCSDHSSGTTSLQTLWRDPGSLFDPQSTPVIQIGPVAVPGPLLPLVVSAMFIYTWIVRLRNRGHRQIDIQRLPPNPRRHDPQWPDPREPGSLSVYTAKATAAFHAVITIGALMHFGQSFLDINTLCCCQVIALLLHGEVVRPESRKTHLVAAVGWTLFTFLDQLSDIACMTTACVVILLSTPAAWQMDGRRGEMFYQQSGSATLLMLIAANKIIFSTPLAAQEWVREHPWGAGACLHSLLAINACMFALFNRGGGMRCPSVDEMYSNIKRSCVSALRFICLAAAFLAPLVGGIICTAYMYSCLPWRSLWSGKCALPPSLSTLSLVAGIFTYTTIFLTMMSLQHDDRPRIAGRGPIVLLRARLRTNAEALGWSATLLTLLYIIFSTLT